MGVFTSTGSLVTHSLQRAESSSAALDWTFAQLEVAAAGRLDAKQKKTAGWLGWLESKEVLTVLLLLLFFLLLCRLFFCVFFFV